LGRTVQSAAIRTTPGKRLVPAAPPRHPLLRYAAAPVTVGLAVALKFLLVPLVEQDTPFLLFSSAVLLTAWYGGLGPGLVATALAGLASNFFFIVPFYRLELAHPADRFRLAVFVVEGAFISALAAALHAAKRAADDNARLARALRRRVLDVAEHEMRRIGRDLHDGLGQLLTGTAFMSRALAKALSSGHDEARAADAQRIEQNVNRAVRWTRDLAAALAPVSVESGALPPALREMAARASEMFEVCCEFQADEPAGSAPLGVKDPHLSASQATHLYRIAQEAVSNAVRHGDAHNIRLRLATTGTLLRLSIEDDGSGFDAGDGTHPEGMGMHTMADRARMVGGTLAFGRAGLGGAAVVCTCPAALVQGSESEGGGSDR
jgi:signal transduction histidine kinase